MTSWRGNGAGVALVRSAGEQILHLSGTVADPARVASLPTEIVGGATYRAAVGCESFQALGCSARVVWADADGKDVGHSERALEGSGETGWEVSAPLESSFASLAIGSAGGDLYLRSVTLRPVGPRLEIPLVYTDRAVLPWDSFGFLQCEVHNCGSETITQPFIEIRAGRELVSHGVEPTHTLPALEPGRSVGCSWPLTTESPGAYAVQVRVRGGGCTAEKGGSIVVGEEPIRLTSDGSALETRRTYVSVSTRTFRLIIPKLEFGFGTGQFDFGDPFRFGGWVRALGAAYSEPGGPPRLLYGRRSRIDGGTLMLYNSDHLADWEITFRANLDLNSIGVLTRYIARRDHTIVALEGINVCISQPETVVETVQDEYQCALAVRRGERLYSAILRWQEMGGSQFRPGPQAASPTGWLSATMYPKETRVAAGRQLIWHQDLWIGPIEQAI